MQLIVLDFESYYDSEYSLSKMSTEDYVCDPRFDVIMAGVKVGNSPAVWAKGGVDELRDWFDEIGLWDSCVVAHNMMFDGLILQHHFGRLPKKLLCTRFMANPFFKPHLRSVSLEACLKFTGLGTKGGEVKNMLARTRDSLTREEWQRYGAYCANDCETEYALFKYLAPLFPREEFDVIDLTLRMYLEPRARINAAIMAKELANVTARKEQELSRLPAGVTAAHLASNAKFAAILEMYGVDVPMKISLTTGKELPALAKNDPGFKELEEEYHDHPDIGPMLTARVGVKSTLEVSRYTRLLDIGLKYKRLRMPLIYYSAHTGRYGGAEKINAQNFPRIDKSRMRFGICAPKGHVMLAADLAQIEARITAWLAEETKLVQAFREKRDIYSEFATQVFRTETVKDRSPADKARRFVGKTCILGLGYGMGATKLKDTLRKDNMIYNDKQCTHMVDVYRDTYSAIPRLWHKMHLYIESTARSNVRAEIGPLTFAPSCIILPNGMPIQYPQLRTVERGQLKGKLKDYKGLVYTFAGETRTLWGGKVVENVVQALARIIIMRNMITIAHTLDLNPILQQHDELDYIVQERHADEYAREITRIMRVPPVWAPDLPVDVEVNFGPTLGDCK